MSILFLKFFILDSYIIFHKIIVNIIIKKYKFMIKLDIKNANNVRLVRLVIFLKIKRDDMSSA
jgi:hypothetical protein